MTTVKELIDILKTLPEDAIVISQRDGEGNGYSPLADVEYDENYGYIAETTWSGYTAFSKITEDLKEEGYQEEDCDESAVKAVFLIPTN